jgi:hypothetical protein
VSKKDDAVLLAPAILGQPMTGSDGVGWSVKIGISPIVALKPGINFEFGLYRAANGTWVSHMSANGHSQFKVCEAKTRRGAVSAIEREFEKLWLAVSLVRAKVGAGVREVSNGG